MLLPYPARSLHLLRAGLALLVFFTIYRYLHISSKTTTIGKQPAQNALPVHDGSPAAPVQGDIPQDNIASHGTSKDVPGLPPASVPPPELLPPSSRPDTLSMNLPLPDEYAVHDPTSEFCAARFTTKWFDVVRAGHVQYCIGSAASRLHCFHTPPEFHNDQHVDTFCIAQNVVFDPGRDMFTLDCPLTKHVPPGVPASPWTFHQYWYETGPGPIFWRWITLQDTAGMVRHAPIKGPVVIGGGGVAKPALGSSSLSSPASPGQQPQYDREPDLPGRPTERAVVENEDNDRRNSSSSHHEKRRSPAPGPSQDSSDSTLRLLLSPESKALEKAALAASDWTPRTFTYLLKREGSGNIFHCLHEILSMTQTFDALRTTRDPVTGNPFFVTMQDVANTQIVIIDGHSDGPYFDL
ncbi:uncharacterized protein B0I36DRAFT_370496, partial [Microdochium trichocladiopsis]